MRASTSRTRIRVPKSCLQCRRRHQKCIPSPEGACQNCLRRFPPVECVGLPSTKDLQWSISTLPTRDRATTPQPPSRDLLPLSSVERRRVIAETPRIFGGILTEMTTLNGMPIESTLRVAELAHLFNQYVVPNYVSIDGQNLPPMFKTAILPWMIQSPLMPNIAILMASYSERLERGIEGGSDRERETLVIKSHVLGLVQRFLEQDFGDIADEAIRAITHLVILEWWWGSERSLWAHMKGIREMVRILGGLENLPDPTLTNVLTLTDIELSCCYERPLFFTHPISPPASPTSSSPAPSIPPTLSSPLYASQTTFRAIAPLLRITPQAADILDDIRFLTLSITSSESSSSSSTAKIQSTAKWLLARHSHHPSHPSPSTISSPSISPSPTSSTTDSTSTPTDPDVSAKMIESTIRKTATLYTTSIATLTPFRHPSRASRALIGEIKTCIRGVGMRRWKEMPGVLLWILIVICPGLEPPLSSAREFGSGSREEGEGEGDDGGDERDRGRGRGREAENDEIENRGLRKRLAVTGMAIGLEGFGLGIEFLRAGFRVQRWIAGCVEDGGRGGHCERERDDNGGGDGDDDGVRREVGDEV